MRISTKMMFDTGAGNLQSLQSDMYKLQNEMSTGRRILTPADSPVEAAQALVVTQQQSINQQYISNQGAAGDLLAQQEGRLSAINDLLLAVKDRVNEVKNTGYSNQNRASVATDIRLRYETLLGLANASDSMGNYVFAGTRGDTAPFTASGQPGSRTVSYLGDDGRRQLQVSSGRIMDVSDAGSEVFMRIPAGDQAFSVTDTTTPAPATPAFSIGPSSLISGYDGNTYTLTYNAGSFSVTSSDGSTIPSVPYTPGQDVVVTQAPPASLTLRFSIVGTPANGDTITVAPRTNKDIFSTLDDMIRALESNVSGSATEQQSFTSQMGQISQQIDNAMNVVLNKITMVGSRRSEIESLSNFSQDVDLQYQNQLSNLQNLDYTEAISSLSNRKMVLEAAQASFSQVSQLSLFKYL